MRVVGHWWASCRGRRICAARTVAMLGMVGFGLAGCAINSKPPVISGGAQGIFVSTTQLNATTGSWGGTAPIAYAYQWQDCTGPNPAQAGFACTDIPGATSPAFVPATSDVGSYPRVAVTATDSGTNATSATAMSNPTAVPVQSAGGGLQNTNAPTITPQADPSNTEHVIVLSATPGVWTGGVAPLSESYQWQDCNGDDPSAAGFSCSDATGDSGSTGATFTPGAADVGSYLRVAVTATDSSSPVATATAYAAPTQSSVQAETLSADMRCSPVGTPRGTLLYFHAGGYLLDITFDSAEQICQQWAAQGYATDVVAYALGDPATAEAQAVQEAAAAQAPVFALGESAGGTFAEWLAVHGEVSAAVSVAGISDMTTWGTATTWQMFGLDLAQRAALSPLEAVSGAQSPAPLALFHSPADTVVDYQQSVDLLNSLQTACGTCAMLTNLTGDHLVDLSWQPATVQWLSTVLTAPRITTPNSVTFTAGTPGSFTVRTAGAGTPSLSEVGALPAGVSFTDNGDGTGTLAGTAALAGRFPITLTAHGSGGPDAVLSFTLTVTPLGTAPTSGATPRNSPAIVGAHARGRTRSTSATRRASTTLRRQLCLAERLALVPRNSGGRYACAAIGG